MSLKLGTDVSGVMLDMDGTVYLGGKAIDGAAEFIERLNKAGIPYAFITNNSSHTRDFYFKRLEGMGFPVSRDSVITSAVATAGFIKTRRPEARVFLMASPDVKEEFISNGVNVTDDDPNIVLLTYDRTITYDRLNKAYHLIVEGAELIATHPDDLCPTEDGYDVDIGPFIRLFESLTGKEAVVVGKPNCLLPEMAADLMGVDIEGTVMIGDRLYTDIKMADNAGIRSVLVLSGETTEGDIKDSDTQPTYVVRSVADIEISGR